MARLIVFVAGPYRAATPRGIVENIRRAESVALAIWRRGHVAICPHLNSALFDGELPDSAWLAGYLAVLGRCDAVVLVDGWRSSAGTAAEVQAASGSGIPIYHSATDLPAAGSREERTA